MHGGKPSATLIADVYIPEENREEFLDTLYGNIPVKDEEEVLGEEFIRALNMMLQWGDADKRLQVDGSIEDVIAILQVLMFKERISMFRFLREAPEVRL